MKKKYVAPERTVVTPQELNRASRRAAVLVLNTIIKAAKLRTSTWAQMAAKKDNDPELRLIAICDEFMGKDAWDTVNFNPFLMTADAHLYLSKHATECRRGHWRENYHTSGEGPFQKAKLVVGSTNKEKYTEYGKSRVVDAVPVYKWRDCLVMVDCPIGSGHYTCVLVTPKGKVEERLREFEQHYLENCYIKNKYAEVWTDQQGGLHFSLVEVEMKDVLMEDTDDHKIARIERVVENWDKLERGERRMGFLLYGSPGTGKTATISQLVLRLKGKATVLCLKGGSQAALVSLYSWLDKIGPNMVIAEDFDTLSTSRDNVHTYDGEKKFISILLNVLDGAKQHDVITMATTNYPDRLDQALTRPGRLGISLKLGEPSNELRKRIIGHYALKFGLDQNDAKYYEALNTRGVLGCHVFNILKEVSVEVKLGESAHDALHRACQSYFGADNVNWEIKDNKKPMGFGKEE